MTCLLTWDRRHFEWPLSSCHGTPNPTLPHQGGRIGWLLGLSPPLRGRVGGTVSTSGAEYQPGLPAPSRPGFQRLPHSLSGEAPALLSHQLERHAQQALRGLAGGEGSVRGEGHVVEPGQRMARRQRLGGEHVEPGMADPAGLERLDEGRLVDDRAARC